MSVSFEKVFEELTGFSPFEWQRSLYHDYFAEGRIPSALDIPTGLGKTSVMVVWYLALKVGAVVPRRLVYVVDRRAVVDQATTVADEIRDKSEDVELRVSTLRGQHVDNREWLADPARPAIVVGTVDMIGSRLLFSGYGVSRKMRPYQAGLLGADALVVLDEAHLIPAFEKLLAVVANTADVFGPRDQKDRDIVPPLKMLSLSATGRENATASNEIFRLSLEHRGDEAVRKRLQARKRLAIQTQDASTLVAQLAERAWSLSKGLARVLVYCDRREDAVKVKGEIDKRFRKEKHEPVSELLVGGRRVFERQALSDWLRKHGFLGDAEGRPGPAAFLIATSAGEVGVDLDADHMVCDLVAWERMVQRLGRVNRRGNGDALIEVIAAPWTKEPQKEWEERLARLRKPLDSLRCENSQDERDASPGAILDFRDRAKQDQYLREAIEAATTPVPLRPALTRALVDAWSLTSLEKHTGRPDDVQPWLRGWEEDQRPQTTVVWRKYLPVREDGTDASPREIESFFEAAPPHASEKLETETYVVADWLMKRAKSYVSHEGKSQDDTVGYALSPARDYRCVLKGRDLVDSKDNKKWLRGDILAGCTLVVDAEFGGLSKDGMLDEKANWPPRVLDDGEEWLPAEEGTPSIRFRVRYFTGEQGIESDSDWRERYRFATEQSPEGEAQCFLLVEKWRHDSETEEDRSSGHPQELAEHHAWTEGKARSLADALRLPEVYASVLALAARLHDEGKRHVRWQRAFNAPRDGRVYAKTKGPISFTLLDNYRHELGSLPYAEGDEEFKALSPDSQELVLHLVAAHHGWARPVISTSGSDDPPSVLEDRARDVALRMARLQKRWGPWGLAWLEALLRAADQQASRDNDARAGTR